LTPIGKGTARADRPLRAQPAKTVLLEHIAHGRTPRTSECTLVMLLVDERPEK